MVICSKFRLRCQCRRGKRKRARRPFRQGDLDGLCGVYSVVNAVRTLCPEVDGDGAAWLFDKLIQSLRKVGANPSIAVAGGVGRGEVESLIRAAIACVDDEYDVALAVRRLPKAMRQTKRLDELWQALATAISPRTVAVLGLGGKQSHWTVAVGVSANQIRLFDSSCMNVLRRSDCTVGKGIKRTAIPPTHVILIARKKQG